MVGRSAEAETLFGPVRVHGEHVATRLRQTCCICTLLWPLPALQVCAACCNQIPHIIMNLQHNPKPQNIRNHKQPRNAQNKNGNISGAAKYSMSNLNGNRFLLLLLVLAVLALVAVLMKINCRKRQKRSQLENHMIAKQHL